MNTQDLQKAVERLGRTDAYWEEAGVRYNTHWVDERNLIHFTREMLDPAPIDEQWLRERWRFRDYGPYRIANLDTRGPLITWWLDSIEEGHSRLDIGCGSNVHMTRGQFNALMYSLGNERP